MSKNIREGRLERITAPASEVLTLTETKLYLRIDATSEDSLISDLIVAARMCAENYLKKSLISQMWKLIYDDYLDDSVDLPMPPVVSVSSVTIVNRDATTDIVSAADYYLNAAKTKLLFDNQTVGFRIEITYSTGYGNAAQVPTPIKYGMLAHIAALYENRGDMSGDIPAQSAVLYSPFREIVL